MQAKSKLKFKKIIIIKNMEKTKLSKYLIVVLIIANIAWAYFYYAQRKELIDLRQDTKASAINAGVVVFARDFVDTVLRAKAEVDFETRLRLENSVRDLKDKDVLAQWGKFVNSKSEFEAQEEVKNLLGLLMNKIEIK